MQATVQVDASGTVIANLDSDDFADDDDSKALLGLTAELMLDQCSRVAIAAWLEIHGQAADEGEAE